MHPGTLRTWLNPSKREPLLHTQRLFSCCCTDAFACLPSDFKSPVNASVHGVDGCRRYHEPVSQNFVTPFPHRWDSYGFMFIFYQNAAEVSGSYLHANTLMSAKAMATCLSSG